MPQWFSIAFLKSCGIKLPPFAVWSEPVWSAGFHSWEKYGKNLWLEIQNGDSWLHWKIRPRTADLLTKDSLQQKADAARSLEPSDPSVKAAPVHVYKLNTVRNDHCNRLMTDYTGQHDKSLAPCFIETKHNQNWWRKKFSKGHFAEMCQTITSRKKKNLTHNF